MRAWLAIINKSNANADVRKHNALLKICESLLSAVIAVLASSLIRYYRMKATRTLRMTSWMKRLRGAAARIISAVCGWHQSAWAGLAIMPT